MDSKSKRDYDRKVMRYYSLKLHSVTDADIIKALDGADNKQALIKAAIREYIGAKKETSE